MGIKEVNDAIEKYGTPRSAGLHGYWKADEVAGRAAIYDESAYVATGEKVYLAYLPLDISAELLRDIAGIAAVYFRAGKETGRIQIQTKLRELMGI